MSEKEENQENFSGDEGMNFWEHLDELRKRLLWAVIGIALACVITGYFHEFLIEQILIRPSNEVGLTLQNLRVFGQPFMYFKVVLVAGIILAFPFLLYQIWLFVEPGLYTNERSWARRITFFTSLCFLTGVGFAYFVMIPSMLKFAASFGSDLITNNIDINEYLSFVTMILLAAGLLFEMPMVSFILSRVGILTPKILRKYWRHAIVAILILAAILTPTPDPISQMIFAAPLFLLYEISVWVSAIAAKKYKNA
jgi:sec-independent protein translocase protein TatC